MNSRTKKYLDGRAVVTVKFVKHEQDSYVLCAEYRASLKVDGIPIFSDLRMTGLIGVGKKIPDQIVEDAAGFMTLQSGDTDADYFDKYTPEQMAWATSFDCECMSGEVWQ